MSLSVTSPLLRRSSAISLVMMRRTLATGTRGARGHGWFVNYRAGKGGRHLQGEYFEHETLEQQLAWNQAILELGSTNVEMELKVVPKAEEEPSSVHRLMMRLASTVMPETCDNFVQLAEREYSGTKLYRMERNVGFCGGDVLTNTGRSGRPAVSSPTDPLSLPIVSDPLAMWHVPGTVTMLVSTVGEVDSRFLLCHSTAPHMNGIHRAFGVLENESIQVLQQLQGSLLTKNGVPINVDLVIGDCKVSTGSHNDSNINESEGTRMAATTSSS
jgi:cyclophilin family peptidyl-prolyl cis-trans isomerase